MKGLHTIAIVGILFSIFLLATGLIGFLSSYSPTQNLTIPENKTCESVSCFPITEKNVTENITLIGERKVESKKCPFAYHVHQLKASTYIVNEYTEGFYTFKTTPSYEFLLVFLNITNEGNEIKHTPTVDVMLITNLQSHTQWYPALGIYSLSYSPKPSTKNEIETLTCSYPSKIMKPNHSILVCMQFEILKTEKPKGLKIRDEYCEFSLNISHLSIENIYLEPIALNETKNVTSVPALNETKNQTEVLYKVVRVIDGDTFDLENGERVRLLGINAPERGQECYEEATNRLKVLVEGKSVKLEKDIDDRDQYGRLLRYVFINNKFVNLILVQEGLANVYIVEPNTKYERELREAENYAKENHIGCLWQTPELTCSRCIGISFFHYDAQGNDCDNLNDEYVVFRNTCNFDCNLTGWKVKDEANHIYNFPIFTLKAGKEVTLYTGCGENTETKLYWCNSGSSCNAIWNNDHDTLYMWDNEGKLVLSYSY